MWNHMKSQQVFVVQRVTVLVFSFHVLLSLRGARCFSLTSSPPTKDGHITVCPHTSVTLTCTATGVGSLAWRDQSGQIDAFVIRDNETEESRVVNVNPYTLKLVALENLNGTRADFTSTLEVMVDDIDNGTNITCSIFRNQMHFLIYKTSPPQPPYNVMLMFNYHPDNYSIIISWETAENMSADEYRIMTNTTTRPISTANTFAALEGQYNIPMEITLSAINCAGSSTEVKEEVHVAGCPPPSPPVNGSVSEFTSSRVGAQVTYSCHSDLVLMGGRVAICSQRELQWIPTSDNVICVQTPECGDPSEQLKSHVSISSLNGSVITFSCDPGYSLHGSTTSQCVAGEWTPTPESVTCQEIGPFVSDKNSTATSSSSLSISEAVIITAVVCVVCSFTAGLLFGVLLSRCSVHCHRKQERGQTEPVYETDILPEKGTGIELQCNEAYGRI